MIMNGIINVYKEKGFTSHDVVAKLRGILHLKKIGHTGTLDPDAVGVLPVCVGKATKVCGLLTDRDKTYVAEVKLGITTDTLDMTGTVLEERTVTATERELLKILPEFTGVISQTPPMYSAVKVGGKRLYELARQGKEVEREPREVTVHSLHVTDINWPEREFSMEVTCSKGTYIRSLCQDIGERLGCGGAMKSLVRTRVGQFCLAEAKTLGEIEQICREQGAEQLLLPVDRVFGEYASCRVAGGVMRLLKNGNPLPAAQCHYEGGHLADGEQVRVYGEDGDFYAIYRYEEERQQYRSVKMFHD